MKVNKFEEDKISRINTEIQKRILDDKKTINGFIVDNNPMSGTLTWESDKYIMYATPFYDDQEHIPINIIDVDGNEFECYSIKQKYVTSEEDIDDYLETYYDNISKITSNINKRVELEELLPLILIAKVEVEFNCNINGKFVKSL